MPSLASVASDLQMFRQWSDALADLRGARYPNRVEYIDRAKKFVAFQRYFGALVHDREARPRDDLITDIVAARTNGRTAAEHGRAHERVRPVAPGWQRDNFQRLGLGDVGDRSVRSFSRPCAATLRWCPTSWRRFCGSHPRPRRSDASRRLTLGSVRLAYRKVAESS